jgi:hypothetical protein
VIAGVLLVVIGIALGYFEFHSIRAQADRDFAHCSTPQPPPDCVAKRRPITVVTSRSSDNAFRPAYAISIQTGSHTTLTLGGLSHDEVAPFEQQSSAKVLYRNGHATAVVASDGTELEVPFVFSVRLAVFGGIVAGLVLLGGGLLAWGFTRVNRSPQAT